MVVKPEQERVRNLLQDTVTLLCKNGLAYNKEMKVQGLLGVTLDEDEVFVVHINDIFKDQLSKDIPSIDFPASLDMDNNKDSEPTSSKKRRKRRGSKDSDSGSLSGNATPSKRNRDAHSEDSQEVRIKQEAPEDVICLEDNDNGLQSIKPDPLRDASFSASSFGQLDQHTQPYVTGMMQSGAHSVTSQMSDNSNASWDGSSSSQLPQLTPYKGAAGMQAAPPGPGGAGAWNAADPSVSAAAYYSSLLTRRVRRRGDGDGDKHVLCTFPGCNKTFYERKNMLQHQTLKHGRPKAVGNYRHHWLYDEVNKQWYASTEDREPGTATEGASTEEREPGEIARS